MTFSFRSFVVVMAFSAPSLALADVGPLDTNADGVLTIDEVQAVYPDITVDSFSAMDVNADGTLDLDEVAAAQEAGMMPPTQG